MPAATSRRQAAAEARRPKVATLYAQGVSQVEIALRMGVHRCQISRDIELIRGEWLRSSAESFGARRARELAHLDVVETEAWAAWELSKTDFEGTVEEKATGGSRNGEGGQGSAVTRNGKGKIRETGRHSIVTTRESRLPGAEYLRVILGCIKQRCELMGLADPDVVPPPARLDITSGGKPIEQRRSLTAEDLTATARLLEQAGLGTPAGGGP